MKPITFRAGDKVHVYEDPITQQHLEGTATLHRFLGKGNDNLEEWEVSFKSDPGMRFPRLIAPGTKTSHSRRAVRDYAKEAP